MLKKIVSKIMVILLFTSILTLVFRTVPVKAWTGTIIIEPSGAINPFTAPMLRNGDIYTLTDNIINDAYRPACIIVERDNITLDGGNHIIQGQGPMSDYRGVDFSERTNVTIKNTEIREFDIGISFFHSLNCIATRNKLANNGFGILVSNSSNNFIIGNNIMTNYFFGILLEWSSNNKVYHNNFIDNWSDLGLVDSTNVWDNGYPSGGNYWDGYTGADARRGPNQDQPGSDGIGDTPYIMYGVIDHYPLMSPYGAPAPKPVGGISFAMEGFAPIQPFTQYLGLVAILAIGFTAFKRKTARKTK